MEIEIPTPLAEVLQILAAEREIPHQSKDGHQRDTQKETT